MWKMYCEKYVLLDDLHVKESYFRDVFIDTTILDLAVHPRTFVQGLQSY